MSGWWVHNLFEQGGLAMVVSWVFWVIFSIVMHELAHGWTALWQGDDTPRRLGHMTWNPLVHMGAISLLMFAVVGITWGLMPTDPSKYRWRRRGRTIVALAGPAMNVALAIFTVVALVLWEGYGSTTQPLSDNLRWFFRAGAFLNVQLALFNMLPIPPLDGSAVLEGLWMRWYIWTRNPQFILMGSFLLLAVLISGASSMLAIVGVEAISTAADWLRSLLL